MNDFVKLKFIQKNENHCHYHNNSNKNRRIRYRHPQFSTITLIVLIKRSIDSVWLNKLILAIFIKDKNHHVKHISCKNLDDSRSFNFEK